MVLNGDQHDQWGLIIISYLYPLISINGSLLISINIHYQLIALILITTPSIQTFVEKVHIFNNFYRVMRFLSQKFLTIYVFCIKVYFVALLYNYIPFFFSVQKIWGFTVHKTWLCMIILEAHERSWWLLRSALAMHVTHNTTQVTVLSRSQEDCMSATGISCTIFFLLTNQTAFTMDFMQRQAALVQRCVVAFLVSKGPLKSDRIDLNLKKTDNVCCPRIGPGYIKDGYT